MYRYVMRDIAYRGRWGEGDELHLPPSPKYLLVALNSFTQSHLLTEGVTFFLVLTLSSSIQKYLSFKVATLFLMSFFTLISDGRGVLICYFYIVVFFILSI